MTTILWQEWYKIRHRRLPWLLLVVMVALMIGMGLVMGRSYSRLLAMTCYDSSMIIMLLLVIVGSTIFSQEFQNGTIITMAYRSKSRAAIFFAKLIALFLYDLALHVLAMLVTILLNIVPVINDPVDWFAVYQYHQPLWINMLATTGVDLVASALIVSLVCLASCLINSNTLVIAINALIIFMGSGLSANLLMAHVGPSQIIRWNPFNMLNLTNQYYNYATYHLTSQLTNSQLLVGTLAYTVIFIMAGYLVFRRKKF